MQFTRADFPDDFIFGAATAAYQIEGHSFGGAGPTHWDTFAAAPGTVFRNHDGAVACDHFHRYEEDLDLLSAAGMDAYRFSTSWARVMPEGKGEVNTAGLDFYDRLVDAMLARGLSPYQTLYHWELPAALSDLGGWTNRDVAKWFGDFVEVIMARIGDRVESVATLNEPWCVSYLSHYLGHHAPGLRDIRAAARSMHHCNLAHAEAMERLRARNQKNCGIVINFEHTAPADDSAAAVDAADLQDAIMNRWFIEAITKGTYPTRMIDAFGAAMPKGWENDLTRIHQPIDWLGVNYYTRHLIADDPASTAWPGVTAIDDPMPKTAMDWAIYPDGLAALLQRLAADYVGDLPMFVTENGMAWDDAVTDGAVNDPVRAQFINDHILATNRAIDAGANVKGFFYWSLLDNYEWAFGYDKRFGLVHVDYETQVRTPKASYHALAKALQTQD